MKKAIICFILCFSILISFTGCSLFDNVGYDDGKSVVAQIGIGETATYENISWSINECRNDKSIPTTLGGNITTNNNFVRIELVVFNGGSVKYSPKLSMIKLRLKDPQAIYEPSDYIYAHNRMGTKDVAPQMSVNYQVIFETPFTTYEKDFEILIHVNKKPIRTIFINL